ncbi:MAG: M3 family metallopeptidase [Bryobacteraceae bacterium]
MRHSVCLVFMGVVAALSWAQTPPVTLPTSNPFYSPSTLPFQAPPFNRIQDSDYQPAIEAGLAEALKEVQTIADDPAPATFENTILALQRLAELLDRVERVFEAVTLADANPELQRVQQVETPKLSALRDAITLNPKLFARVQTIYEKRDALGLDAQSRRLVELIYRDCVHAGAKLSDADKTKLKDLNGQLSVLANNFSRKLLAATRDAAFNTTDPSALAGLPEEQKQAAADSAKVRKQAGYTILLQNTTQQPSLQWLSNRETRNQLFENSWNRAERGGDNDTRETIGQLAHLRAQKAKLMGYPDFAAWKIEDQMAKTPDAALKFMDSLVRPATEKVKSEAREIQAVIDAQKGGFSLAAYDWDFYAEQVRKAKYDLNESEVRPYFELNTVLRDGVFYAAGQLYGITFVERHDIPVYHPDVRVFEVREADGKPLALFYTDYFKRDNKQGGAWTTSFAAPSRLLRRQSLVCNVANFSKPAPGQPALLSWDDVRTIFHEFGHALHAMFADVEYPGLTSYIPRDFVEFPSQFNEHWMNDPKVFTHFARNYKTGEPMPAALAAKLHDSEKFNQGYLITELLSAAELDMQWHLLPADAPLQNPDTFEGQTLERKGLHISAVPPRYRSSYFFHIWSNSYSAGYYAYLWSQMIDNDAYGWFTEHGGLTRANGDRFRHMVLSKGSSEDFERAYEAWRGGPPSIEGLLNHWGLVRTQ